MDACKRGLPAALVGAPRLQQMCYSCPQQESHANCHNAEWRRQEIALVEIPVRITNPSGRFVKILLSDRRAGAEATQEGQIAAVCQA
jgi:hypothetical protein